MACLHYKAEITHNEKTIEKMYVAQYYSYEQLRMYLRFVLGIVLAGVAILASLPMWLRAMMLLLSGWLISSADFPAQIRADRVCQARKGKLPVMQYDFYEDRISISGEGSMTAKYNKFEKLVEDSGYLYMFMSKDSVCMIDKATVSGASLEDFKAFLAEKTGVKWKYKKSMLAFNLYDIRDMFKQRKEEDRRL